MTAPLLIVAGLSKVIPFALTVPFRFAVAPEVLKSATFEGPLPASQGVVNPEPPQLASAVFQVPVALARPSVRGGFGRAGPRGNAHRQHHSREQARCLRPGLTAFSRASQLAYLAKPANKQIAKHRRFSSSGQSENAPFRFQVQSPEKRAGRPFAANRLQANFIRIEAAENATILRRKGWISRHILGYPPPPPPERRIFGTAVFATRCTTMTCAARKRQTRTDVACPIPYRTKREGAGGWGLGAGAGSRRWMVDGG